MNVKYIDLKKVNAEIFKKKEIFRSWAKLNSYILGSHVKHFEEKYAAFSGTKYCVSVASGYDAIYLTLLAWGLKKGDEIVVPAQTFIATWLAVQNVGATPVGCDIDPVTLNIDHKKIQRLITKNTKAIIPVHLCGRIANLCEIKKIAKKYELKVLEDNAQAQGGKLHGSISGGIGDAGATSFYPTKNLGCLGDGGAITTNDKETAEKVVQLRNYGSVSKYHYKGIGINSRLDEVQAVFLIEKLKHLKHQNKERQKIAQIYNENIKNENIRLPSFPSNDQHVWHIYSIRTKQRDALQGFLKKRGVETVIHYPIPPVFCDIFSKRSNDKFIHTKRHCAETLSLPCYPNMPIQHLEYVIKKLNKF